MSRNEGSEADTRQRVLESACRLFAERGYRDTTVHDICGQAQANIAAVNYYFGGKDKLFTEAWVHAYKLSSEARVLEPMLTEGRPPEEVLRAFVRARVRDMFGSGPSSYFWRILMLERAAMRSHNDEIREKVFRPTAERLERLMAILLGVDSSARKPTLFVFSLISQMMALNLHFREHLCRRLFGREVPDEGDLDVICDHLTGVVLAGIREAREAFEAEPASNR